MFADSRIVVHGIALVVVPSHRARHEAAGDLTSSRNRSGSCTCSRRARNGRCRRRRSSGDRLCSPDTCPSSRPPRSRTPRQAGAPRNMADDRARHPEIFEAGIGLLARDDLHRQVLSIVDVVVFVRATERRDDPHRETKAADRKPSARTHGEQCDSRLEPRQMTRPEICVRITSPEPASATTAASMTSG